MENTFYKKGDELYSSGRRYSVVTCIKNSWYSEVYKIERLSDNRVFLLKILKVSKMSRNLITDGKPSVIRYLDTSNIARELSVFDWGILDNDHYFIISRYFTKGLLSDRLRQGSLKLATAVDIVLDLAKKLSSLQAYDPVTMQIRQMRHGDVSPENIMYDFDEKGDYRTYLIDLEHISFIADDKHDAVLAPEVRWIDHKHCAPEVFKAEPVSTSDVFSLGIVFYECCFGEYPFPYNDEEYRKRLEETGENVDFRYLTDIMSKTPYYLSLNHCGGMAGLIIRLTSHMLEFDPGKRFNLAAVITQLNILRQVLKVHKCELNDESCFEDGILDTYRRITREQTDTFTLHEDRIRMEFEHDMGCYYKSDEDDDFLKMLKEDFGLEETSDDEKDDKTPEIDEKEESDITNPELGYRPLIRRPAKNAGGFKDVAGMDELKDRVKKKILFFLANPDLAEQYKIAYPNGMLLYGPPGCGKTFFAEKFAEESGFAFALIKASDLGSTYIHGTQGKINELFKEAKAKAPCIICMDEFDAFAPDRAKVTNSHFSGEVNEFLSQLNNCGKNRIFIIATTNNPEGIDPAVLRSGRLEHKIYIPAPDFEARKAVIKMEVLKRPCTDSIDFDRLAELTDGYVTSDLSLIVNDAAMNAAYARVMITQALLEESIATYRPSISAQILKQHEEIRKRMESDGKDGNSSRIGFK